MTTATGTIRLNPAKREVARRISIRVPLLLFVIGLAYLVVEPVARLASLSFSDGASGYRTAYTAPGIAKVIATTIGLAFGSLAIALVCGVGLAYAATRLPSRLRFLRVLPITPIVIPAVASVVGWAFLLSPRPGYLNAALRLLPWWRHLQQGPFNIYSIPWIVLITGFSLTAYMYLFVFAGIQNLNIELVESARVHGSSSRRVFFSVVLPLLRPAILYGSGVCVLLGLGQFTAPLLLGAGNGISVLTTSMFEQINAITPAYNVAAALGMPLLVLGVAMVLFQRIAMGDQTRFVTHGSKGFRSGDRPSRLAAVAILLFTLVSMVLPLAALAIVAFSKYWSGNLSASLFTLDNFRQALSQTGITSAIRTSLVVSLAAVAISLPVGFVAASLILKKGKYKVIRPIVDVIIGLPMGVPAVIFGVAFLLAYTHAPFILYGTRWVIILVYVTLMLPFTTRIQLSGMTAVGESYSEASRVSGAGSVRTALQVSVPLGRAALGGAAALMFVLLMNEFAASILVVSATTQVMGTVLFNAYSNGTYPLTACVGLIMTGITAVGVTAAILLGGSDIFGSL